MRFGIFHFGIVRALQHGRLNLENSVLTALSYGKSFGPFGKRLFLSNTNERLVSKETDTALVGNKTIKRCFKQIDMGHISPVKR